MKNRDCLESQLTSRYCCQQLLVVDFLFLALAIVNWEIENGFLRRIVRQINLSLPKNSDLSCARSV